MVDKTLKKYANSKNNFIFTYEYSNIVFGVL